MRRGTASFAGSLIVALTTTAIASASDEPEPVPPALDPDVEGPPRPPPVPPPDTDGSDYALPRPVEAPIEPEPELVTPRFGTPGQVVVSANLAANISYAAFSGPSQAAYFDLSFQPGFDVFVARNFSVGASIFANRSFSRTYDSSYALVEREYVTLGAGPRLGYAIPLGRWASLYPTATLAIDYVSTREDLRAGRFSPGQPLTPSVRSGSRVDPYVYLFAPVLLHPASNFFVGAGPALFHHFGGSKTDDPDLDQRTSFGGRMTVGGYWGGTPVPHDRKTLPPPSPAPTRYHFGEARDVVLTGDLFAGASVDRLSRTDRTVAAVSFRPAIDYFVEKHFSVGAGFGIGHTKATQDSTDSTIYTYTTVSLDLRVGAQVPLSQRLSLYPRAGFHALYIDQVAGAAGEGVSYEVTTTAVSLSLPLVVHVAPHLFVGWGPGVSHELSRAYDTGPNDIRRTSVGAGVLVGGWL
ncbi:MAG: hypothetical protein KF819_31080 [Labilithrix sp.]|nr:hypothetical protein [Labilithrix sp.]